MCVLIKCGLGLYMGHLGSKTRSLDQIIEKPCVDNTGHIFHQIFMKFCQNIYLDQILVGIVYRSPGGQKQGHGVKSMKNLV